MLPKNIKLSKYFTLAEMLDSDTARAKGIDNTHVTEAQIEAATALAKNILDPVREHFGKPFSPTSWYRCEQLERVLADSGFKRWCSVNRCNSTDTNWLKYFATKQHPKGMAADLQIEGVSAEDLFDFIHVNMNYDQLLLETNGRGAVWVHVSYNNAGNNRNYFNRNYKA